MADLTMWQRQSQLTSISFLCLVVFARRSAALSTFGSALVSLGSQLLGSVMTDVGRLDIFKAVDFFFPFLSAAFPFPLPSTDELSSSPGGAI